MNGVCATRCGAPDVSNVTDVTATERVGDWQAKYVRKKIGNRRSEDHGAFSFSIVVFAAYIGLEEVVMLLYSFCGV